MPDRTEANPNELNQDDARFFFSSRRRHTSLAGDWSSDVCSSDLRIGIKKIGRLGVVGCWDVY